jgi:hypothetical protein
MFSKRLSPRRWSKNALHYGTRSITAPLLLNTLNLLIAAIILWNTRYLEQTFVELERQGADVSPTIVAHVAPLGWEHVGLTGEDNVWSDGQQPSNGSLRPLRRRESMLAA